MANGKRFWDIFYHGRWIGMTKGKDLEEAKELAKSSLPDKYDDLRYIEWFGRLHPDNCKTSGGNKPDPIWERGGTNAE